MGFEMIHMNGEEFGYEAYWCDVGGIHTHNINFGLQQSVCHLRRYMGESEQRT